MNVKCFVVESEQTTHKSRDSIPTVHDHSYNLVAVQKFFFVGIVATPLIADTQFYSYNFLLSQYQNNKSKQQDGSELMSDLISIWRQSTGF